MSPSSTKSSPSSGWITSRSPSVPSWEETIMVRGEIGLSPLAMDRPVCVGFRAIVDFDDTAATLRCCGDEDRSTQGIRRPALVRAIRAETDVVVDLSELVFADSSVMLDLAVLARRLRVRGRMVRLRGAQPQ